MGTSIERSWAHVTGWLAEHAPASHAMLRPPATHKEIEACERDLGVALPDDLRRLLLVNNGASDFDPDGTHYLRAAFLPGNHRLLSAAEIATRSRSLCEIVAQVDEEMIGVWWHPQWVLFGEHIAADGMAIDQRPGCAQGAVAAFMHEGGTSFDMAPSFGAYIGAVSESLEMGYLVGYFRPVVRDGRLDWDVVLQDNEG